MRFTLLTVLALVAVLTSTVSAARPKWHELDGYTFDRYVSDFKKPYAPHSKEYAQRKELFDAKLAQVRAHNADASKPWRAGVNHMSDYTREELTHMNGGRLRENWNVRKQLRSKPYVKKHQVAVNSIPLPRQVDYRLSIPSILSAIKDQGMCGSCWAHGSTETVESYAAMATGDLFALSQQQVTACAPNPNDCGGTGGCGGSIIELAWDYLIQAGGIAQEWTYPYTAYAGTTGTCAPSITPVVSLTGYTAVTSNQQHDVVDALARAGPLAINVDASNWGMYESGVFTGCDYSKNITIDHVVQLVGYGTDSDSGLDYWIVRNSWSPAWGEHGFIRLLKTSQPECGWDVQPQQGTGCNGGPAQLWTCGMCGILFDTLYPTIKV